jgi:hypothetical protein
MFTKWYQQKEEQEACGLHGKHEEEAGAYLGVFSSNSGGLRAGVRGPLSAYFSNMLRSPPLLFLLCGLYVRMRVGEGGEVGGLFCE